MLVRNKVDYFPENQIPSLEGLGVGSLPKAKSQKPSQ